MPSFLRCLSILIFISVFFASCSVFKGNKETNKLLSPNDFGLSYAKTDIERYYILERTHQIARQKGVTVSYKGIKELNIEIPPDAKGIQLGYSTDFHGVVINVKNQAKDIRLFSIISNRRSIEIPKWCVDKGDFRQIRELAKGEHLLIIEDENPWGDNRTGYDYAHKRRDILLIRNGEAVNRPIMPYNNEFSAPNCTFIDVKGEAFQFKNVIVNRMSSSTYKTYVLYVDGYDNVQIENVIVNTPDNMMSGDHVLRIHNSSNVSIKNTSIKGTYSAEDASGYGVSMNNVWNFSAFDLYGRGNWGIFGCNNINTASLGNCDINRFDIHCYGRDCTFKDVIFEDIGNQFSSVYGVIEFDRCTFTNCDPLINRSSYNAFVGYDLSFKNCIFNVTPKKKYLVNLGDLTSQVNSRPELSKKCWPNIYIHNLTVNMTEGARELVLLTSRGTVEYAPPVGYISSIEVNGLTINSERGIPLKSIVIGTKDVKTENKIECVLNDVKIYEQRGMTKSVTASANDATLMVRLPLKENSVRMKNVKGIKQSVQ